MVSYIYEKKKETKAQYTQIATKIMEDKKKRIFFFSSRTDKRNKKKTTSDRL